MFLACLPNRNSGLLSHVWTQNCSPPAPSLRILGGEFIQGRGGGEGRVGIGGIVLFLFRGVLGSGRGAYKEKRDD